eukprot:1192303-Amphidinium_carterae.1
MFVMVVGCPDGTFKESPRGDASMNRSFPYFGLLSVLLQEQFHFQTFHVPSMYPCTTCKA